MSTETKALNFLEHIIEEDLANGLSKDKLRFRFPPEPNGYLHIGHTKAIGISFGLDRIYLVLEELDLFPETVSKNVEVLFINFGDKEALFSLKAIKHLRLQGINAELYPDIAKMKKQMNHANKRAIPFVVLVGDQEIDSNTYTLKNMGSGEQDKVSLDALTSKIKKS